MRLARAVVMCFSTHRLMGRAPYSGCSRVASYRMNLMAAGVTPCRTMFLS